MLTRPATVEDAPGMAAVQNEIFAAGLRKAPTDVAIVTKTYISDPDRIACTVAVDEDGRILGFQSLKLATAAGNPYGVAEGWGIIGTHVSPSAGRRGVGKALFKATLEAAEAFVLRDIDASIGADNEMGQAYYEAIGFRTYRTTEDRVCKAYRIG
ncbi:GNAT family N-acetyltransferase [Agrobacterium larrymoorei]|uniref:Ribosomal protein S18 acetylase RimI-like enzyme n=1 Tax=Agrobacterium larrymoorei TaxID=160699 RepID=A0ABU0UN60_9HYPH|nr:GNAT family N-acetyltransferase [Agrobacterium larrymoorei]MDQ1186374.1 ribosomal protein S18 acetylase RimI-like enzyme [Agrobacterium larrymoorei]